MTVVLTPFRFILMKRSNRSIGISRVRIFLPLFRCAAGLKLLIYGGERGIRTLDRVSPIHP